MSGTTTDIIIPIWNRPVETRECLAALINHTEDIRLILMDLGCDPDTEQILHEFAEHLDDRAILLGNGRACEFIESVNRGLAKSSAFLRIILRPTSLVTPGWLEPIKEAAARPDAGILVPRLAKRRGPPANGKSGVLSCLETIPVSFDALGITGRLYERIGSFDSRLDGGIWCLKDYARCADRFGFRTLSVDGPPVFCRDEVLYGSTVKREQLVKAAAAEYRNRWGGESAWCLVLPKDAGETELAMAFDYMVGKARQGDLFFILAPHAVHRKLVNAARHRDHENIRIERLPRVFTSGAVRSALARIRERYPEIKVLERLGALPGAPGVQVSASGSSENTRMSAEV